MTIVARADFAPNTIAELLDYVRANKENVTYAHAGVGSASHLCGMLFMDAIDVPMTTVPYKGTGPAMTDLLGGQVDMMCDQTTNTVTQIKSGKIKGYAVTTKERLPVLPDLPTLDESGFEGFEMTVWHGLYAPAGTPQAILDKLSVGAAGGAAGPEGDRALRPARHRAGAARRGDAGSAGLAPQGRGRQVEADHPGRRRLRRLSRNQGSVPCRQRSPTGWPRPARASRLRHWRAPAPWGLSRVRGWPTMTGAAYSGLGATSPTPTNVNDFRAISIMPTVAQR